MAQNILTARDEGEFLSIEDFSRRTKIGKSIIEKLREYNVLEGLSDTNQISLFD